MFFAYLNMLETQKLEQMGQGRKPTCLNNFGTICTYWDSFGTMWTHLDPFGPLWTHLDRF